MVVRWQEAPSAYVATVRLSAGGKEERYEAAIPSERPLPEGFLRILAFQIWQHLTYLFREHYDAELESHIAARLPGIVAHITRSAFVQLTEGEAAVAEEPLPTLSDEEIESACDRAGLPPPERAIVREILALESAGGHPVEKAERFDRIIGRAADRRKVAGVAAYLCYRLMKLREPLRGPGE
ncbi:MAG: hypothetical protein HYV08_08440 [Deltaproteobacteria bacterium]|nr:hypothetical protein [Deltaproteobacteria bacterium]MBI3078921.1 hypothetical protein [Deltaproteobacteria bacterium]